MNQSNPGRFSRRALSLAAAAILSIAGSAMAGTVLFDTTGGTTAVLPGDDNQATVTLPFSFSFYGVSHPNMRVTTNGVIGWTPGGPSYGSIASPGGNAVIAPWWDDLIDTAYNGGSVLAVGAYGNRGKASPSGNAYSVSWTAYNYDDGGYIRNLDANLNRWDVFEATLFGGDETVGGFTFHAGDIAFSYDHVGSLTFTSNVGIASGTGLSQGIPDGLGGYATTVNGSNKATRIPTGDGQFILFRPNANQTAYASSVQSTVALSVPLPTATLAALPLLAGLGLSRRFGRRQR